MRKIMIAITAVALSCSAMAQTKMDDAHMDKMSQKSMSKMHDCVMMKDGKMVTMVNGKTMPMKATTKMSNGTKVMLDGTCKMKDGKSMMLKEGQCVMINGEVMKMPMKKGKMGDMKM
jgi:hypothetical protein